MKIRLFPLLLTLCAFTTFSYAAPPFPIKECLAPAGPGGGWDFTCRSVSKVLFDQKFVPNNIQTVNMAGAGGGVAFAHTVSKRKKDQGLFVAASTATTTRLAQNQFKNMRADMVKWVASIGADYGVIAVSKDSPYQNLGQLIEALKADPLRVKFAGASSVGGWDHLKVLLVAQKGGVENLKQIKYLSFNNGGDAITKVLGKHLDAFIGDISEVQGFIASGDLHVLAVLSEQRLPAPYADIPTAVEQHIPAVAPNWRGFYLPEGVSQEQYQWWVDTLQSLSKTPEWQEIMTKNGLISFDKFGEDFVDYVNQEIETIRTLSQQLGIMK